MADDFSDFFEDLYPYAPDRFRNEAQLQLERIDPDSWVGEDVGSALASFRRLSCGETGRAICATEGRFRVEAEWEDFEGGSGRGPGESLSVDTGTFWFFSEENLEVIVKVLDARIVNQHYWVFYGALSNVAYRLTVTDTLTGAVRTYVNPSGRFASAGDVTAFAETTSTDSSDLSAGARRKEVGGLGVFDARGISLPSESAPVLGTELVSSGFFPFDGQGGVSPVAAQEGCSLTADALCLSAERFRVKVTWADFQGGRGDGIAVPLTADTGAFWFFNETNIELVVKVLDARVINDHFWVFYGALSNVEYEIEVTDTLTGAVMTYHNLSGEFASVGDTAAFP